MFRLYPILPRIWYVHGELAAAAELLDGAIEAGRLLRSPPALAGNLFNRSVVAVAMGDVDLALATAEEGVELTRDLDHGSSRRGPPQAGRRPAQAGEPARGVELLLGRAGGPELTLIPGGWRVYCLELLTESLLALDRQTEAETRSLCCRNDCSSRGSSPRERLGRSGRRRLALHTGDTAAAIQRAAVSADAAQEVGAPIESALSRTLAGRALAQEGQNDRAVAELQRAAATFDVCGALHYRARAERELGRLGHRPHRRTRAGKHDGEASTR